MKRSAKIYSVLGLLIFCLILSSTVPEGILEASSDWGTSSDNLYKVSISSHKDATLLSTLGFDALLRINGGYLMLVKPGAEKLLAESGLDYELVSSGVERSRLALDMRFDADNLMKFPLIFEEEGVRLLKVEPSDFSVDGEVTGLAPILTENIRIFYKETPTISQMMSQEKALLDSIAALVEQDSLYSYVSTLQAFPPRLTGSAANYASRDWIISKLESFGYDSVVQDSFVYSSYQCQNVVAYKTGTTYPDHQIVIGAHRDAVSGSPGADDNGSGTAGVLEIARVMQDIDTKMSYIFVLLDAEEQGLNGAWHYANTAAANGDSIVLMINMDMIANIPNTNSVKLYYGDDDTWAQLCQDLIDTLPGVTLNGVMSGSLPNSDHYAFQQNGYDVILFHEYIFSTVYHSYQDSTSHMNFVYMTRVVKGALATAYAVNNIYAPTAGLIFSYPGGIPEVLTPGVAETFQVQIDAAPGGELIPSSARLHYKIDGQMSNQPYLNNLGGGLYEATLPALDCEQSFVEFWVLADERLAGTMYDPDTTNPNTAFPATGVTTIFEDDFDTDKGWTVSGGLWARGTPTGGGGSYGGPDPTSGHSGSSVFGYNLSGDYTNSMSERHLTTPAMDCSGLYNTKLKFWRWLGVEQPIYDHAYIRISTNGTSWTTIWENTEEVTDFSWVQIDFDIAQYVDNQPTVYIRWTMGTTDGAWTYCGWNIDDVQIVAYECQANTITILTEDVPDWTIDIPISQQLTASGGVGPLIWSDKNGDLSGTGLTLSSEGLLSGTPSSAGPISFTAEVTDGAKAVAEKLFSFDINSAISITTTSLPDWTAGQAYSQTLIASGGTSPSVWIDKNGTLVGSGLALSSSGNLTGTPVTGEVLSFIARIDDNVGAFDEQLLSITINPAVAIQTTTLPDAAEGGAYSEQLISNGGTGTISWSDKNGDLSGTGLTMNTAGLVSGTPTSAGTIGFTARAEDATGSADEKLLDIFVGSTFICGDANGDGEVNIFDITFVISFLYRDGPAPDPIASADVNGDSDVNIFDATYLIMFLYGGGPAPACP